MNFKKLWGISCHDGDNITLAHTYFRQGTGKTRAALVDLLPSVFAGAINQGFVIGIDVFNSVEKTKGLKEQSLHHFYASPVQNGSLVLQSPPDSNIAWIRSRVFEDCIKFINDCRSNLYRSFSLKVFERSVSPPLRTVAKCRPMSTS